MDILINNIKKYVIEKSEEYKVNSSDHYDFWNEHIKYVYYEAIGQAKKYDADLDVVKLGALLHDIALIEEVGERKEHHINGKILAEKILDKYGCSKEVKEKVLGCILNHRSSKNATNNEELCVCDADILAHFDNIPMLFNSAINRNKLSLNEIRNWIDEAFQKDFNDLSDRCRNDFYEKYNMIRDVVLKDVEL